MGIDKYNLLYGELVQISKEIEVYYDIDKIKPYSVYIWTKGEDGENVFDICDGEIVFYDENHIIADEVKPIIDKIQSKIKEISQCASKLKFE